MAAGILQENAGHAIEKRRRCCGEVGDGGRKILEITGGDSANEFYTI